MIVGEYKAGRDHRLPVLSSISSQPLTLRMHYSLIVAVKLPNFHQVILENSWEWDIIECKWSSFHDPAKKLIRHSILRQLQLRGFRLPGQLGGKFVPAHTTVWHSQPPGWSARPRTKWLWQVSSSTNNAGHWPLQGKGIRLGCGQWDLKRSRKYEVQCISQYPLRGLCPHCIQGTRSECKALYQQLHLGKKSMLWCLRWMLMGQIPLIAQMELRPKAWFYSSIWGSLLAAQLTASNRWCISLAARAALHRVHSRPWLVQMSLSCHYWVGYYRRTGDYVAASISIGVKAII